jgi:hypothetical protein
MKGLSICQAAKLWVIRQLFLHPAIEKLDVAALPATACSDEQRLDAPVAEPLPQPLGDEPEAAVYVEASEGSLVTNLQSRRPTLRTACA